MDYSYYFESHSTTDGSDEQDLFIEPSETQARRLPTLPRTTRPVSRPLPQIPRPLACKNCRTCISSSNVLFPQSAMPADARSFKGFHGKASLFTEVYNVKLSRPSMQLMQTGAHVMQEITCSTCSAYLGWKIVKAYEQTEKWKEGNCLLELENLFSRSDILVKLNQLNNSSDSEDSS